MTKSILDTTKKALGISLDYEQFDMDIIMHINSVFSTLNQLGVGPTEAFSITDNSDVWSDFIGNNKSIESVKSYIWVKVKLAFDPPTTSFGIDAFQKMAEELEWRLNVQIEEYNNG